MPLSRSTHALLGSERTLLPGDSLEGDPDPDRLVRLVFKLRSPEAPGPAATRFGLTPPLEREPIAYADYARRFGARESDVTKTLQFCLRHGLKPLSVLQAARLMVVQGTVRDAQTAFNVDLQLVRAASGETFRSHRGPVFVAPELRDVVTAVAGLDDRPGRIPTPEHGFAESEALPVPEFARLYNFPRRLRGVGQRIAVLTFGGGFLQDDFALYLQSLALKQRQVTVVTVGGVPNDMQGNLSRETMLDTEIVGAIAPAADLVVYIGDNTEAGWLETYAMAVHDRDLAPTVMTSSWAQWEVLFGKLYWPCAVVDELDRTWAEAALLGITVTAAAGDEGSSPHLVDRAPHVLLPASSPFILGCGGTTLCLANGAVESETVWNAGDHAVGGGGVSEYFEKPVWQATADVPAVPGTSFAGRGVPDVAADADIDPGYRIYEKGSFEHGSGTSAAAPLWAGLIALINERLAKIRPGCTAGYITPLLYCAIGSSRAFNDIRDGDNGLYSAAKGWDPCTGWGSPNGKELMRALIRLSRSSGCARSRPRRKKKRAR